MRSASRSVVAGSTFSGVALPLIVSVMATASGPRMAAPPSCFGLPSIAEACAAAASDPAAAETPMVLMKERRETEKGELSACSFEHPHPSWPQPLEEACGSAGTSGIRDRKRNRLNPRHGALR